ncbi:hypothetical protein FRC10_007027 [Ceratobasidium sp. 414]|nr:hypothetical protein FRC10_007027 [Ceratobasidium sp. 414]
MSCAVVVPYGARTPYSYPPALPPSLTPPPTPPPPLFPVPGPVELVAPTPRRVASHGHSQSEPCQRPKIQRARRWSSLGDLHADDPPTPRPVPAKASHALAELVDTEATYLAYLRSLVGNYFARLPTMPAADLSALIRNAGALLDLHTRIAADLAAGPTSRSYVCSVFEGWAPYMATLYAEFCAGHDAAAAIFRRAQERDPQLWSSWERQCALHTHRRRHSLDEPLSSSGLALGFSDLLIMPVQRVCKYHLLVSAMRGAPGQDLEERTIMNAVNAMHNVAARVDDAQRVRQAEHRARLVLERVDPAPGLDIAHLAKLGPCILIGSLDVCYYYSPTAPKPPLVSYATASSLATPGPSPHPLPSTVPFPQQPQSQTPTTPHPLSNSQKPLKVRHLAAFLWPGYLVLCKVNAKRGRYEPKHWFLLKQVAGPAPTIDDHLDPDASMEDMSFQQFQPPSMTHVDVSPASTVFTHGVRIAFAKHVFELGTSCAEERDVWLAAVAGAREVEKEVSVGGRNTAGANVSRSRSAVATASGEPEGLELVRSRSEGGRGRSRSRSRPPEKAPWLGIAERVENAFLRDRQGESVSPVSVNASLNGTGAGVTRDASGGSPGRLPVRLSVVSGSGGTFKGTLSAGTAADGRTLGPADGRALGPNGHGHSLSVGAGANVARTNSSSTGGTRSYPPSPVMTTHALQVQPALTPQPQLQPQPQLTVQTQLPVSLVVHRPSASVRDMVDRALADIVSWPCTEARMKGARRGPLFAAPEDPAGPKSAGAALGGGVMSKVRPRRTSSTLVGRHKSLLDALPGKEKEKKKARPASEGVVVEAKKDGSGDAEGGKTPLQRKRATIHGATQPFPTTDPPSPAGEPHAVQVVAPSGQVIHRSTGNGVQGDPAVSTQAQVDVRRNGSTGSQSQESGKRSRTVSSSGSFADGVRELFTLRKTFVKSAENVAVATAITMGPTPIFTVGAGLTNTRSDETLVAKTKPKASSAPALVPDTGAGLYSLGAGITNTTTPPRRKTKPSFSGRAPNLFAALTRRRTRTAGPAPLSALTFTPLSEKDLVDQADMMRAQTARSRSNEWYHPVPALRVASDRAKLGADLCAPTLRVQPSPVAEEGVFADFGDEVYDEERY